MGIDLTHSFTITQRVHRTSLIDCTHVVPFWRMLVNFQHRVNHEKEPTDAANTVDFKKICQNSHYQSSANEWTNCVYLEFPEQEVGQCANAASKQSSAPVNTKSVVECDFV
jgi:hypothetical protein